jgi:WhiB family redox-sensing transcriptional regulator
VSSTEWQERGLCREVGGDEWFPEGGNGQAAKRICARCPVRAECLWYALDNDVRHGIWGGMTDPQRKQLKREAA